MTTWPQVYGIIGYPLGHTLSPKLHNASFKALGLEAIYTVWPLPKEKLADFIAAFRLLQIQGASVTIPHKEAIISYLDEVSPTAKAIGSVNTLYWRGDKLCGENTDVIGFQAPLAEVDWSKVEKVLILGSGGTARTAAFALKSMGQAELFIAGRNQKAAESLAGAFGAKTVPWEERGLGRYQLVVNTTPLGLAGDLEEETPYPAEFFQEHSEPFWAYEVIYNPHETRFLREAKGAGWHTIGGWEMFLAQGAAQFELWTGLTHEKFLRPCHLNPRGE